MIKILFIVSILTSFAAQASYCIAHRGDNENYLENSRESFLGAMEVNADGIEFDLQHTKDKIAIVMHDKTLQRTAISAPGKKCPLNTKINSLSLDTIRNNCLLSNGSPIMTLEDTFDLLENYSGFLFIEFKDRPSLKTLHLIALRRATLIKKTRLISFKRKLLKQMRSLKKKYSFYKKVRMLNVNAFSPFAGKDFDLNIGKWGKRLVFISRWAKKEASVWTVDKDSKIRKLFKRELTFITTNRITKCMEITSQHPH